MYALVNVCYLERNKQLPICSPGSPLALITLVPLANLALLGTHVVPHDNVSSSDMISVSVTIYEMSHGLVSDTLDGGFELITKGWRAIHKYDFASADEEHGLVESICDEVSAVAKVFEIVASLGTDRETYSLLGDWKVSKIT